MVIYIAGAINAPTQLEYDQNIRLGTETGAQLIQMGHTPVCPFLQDAYQKFVKIDRQRFLDADLEIMRRCDAALFLSNWKDSDGARGEHAEAERIGLPIYYATDGLPPLHPVEVGCPNQAREFAIECASEYRLMLRKSLDYSPINILALGEIGALVRMLDKAFRLSNLYGFKIKMTEPGTFDKPKEAANESIEDSLQDISNYSRIIRNLRKGAWGN